MRPECQGSCCLLSLSGPDASLPSRKQDKERRQLRLMRALSLAALRSFLLYTFFQKKKQWISTFYSMSDLYKK